jgi:hypothetical protein
MNNINKTLQNAVFACVSLASTFILSSTFEHVAVARSTVESPYPVEQIWSTAVRFLRVDQRFPILEKDRDAGYILFDFVEEATKVHKASLELVPTVQTSGRPGTKIVLTIPDKPRHVEALLLEKLQKKAVEELGPPPPLPSRPKRDADKTPPDKQRKDDPEAPRDKRPKDSDKTEEDPNQPVRGDDGLPRLPHHNDFPRAE